MERLLAGKPERTDGRLTKNNLWKEAQVSRATMNRAPDILAEWNARLAATDARTPGEARRDDQLAKLRRRLTTVTAERDRLHEQVNAAATVIGALHADNIALRQQLDRHSTVVALDQYR
jgi:capsule polysaccharide export protein KpsE/RkpR